MRVPLSGDSVIALCHSSHASHCDCALSQRTTHHPSTRSVHLHSVPSLGFIQFRAEQERLAFCYEPVRFTPNSSRTGIVNTNSIT